MEYRWYRIGVWDDAKRRSLWARVTRAESESEYLLGAPTRIELRAGREGRDGYVTVDASNPAFADLADVVTYAIHNLPDRQRDERTDE